MITYEVFDYNFVRVGTVKADNVEDALFKAKRKFKKAIAPMVQAIRG